jgi:hypothetical protein
MENEKLTYYWIEDSDADGLKFDPNKGYTLAEIDEILKRNRTNKINGFFVHFGTPGQGFFQRRLIESADDHTFRQKTTSFSTDEYVHERTFNDKIVSNLLELEVSKIDDDRFNKTIGLAKRFGI